MGIILSALAAAGDQGIKSLDQEDAHRRQMERDERMADITTEKAKTLAQFNRNLDVQTANEQRSAASDRINAAQQGIIDSAINQKYAGSDAAVADANAGLTDAPMTPDQQSVIDQSKASDRERMGADPHTFVKAAEKTGDIDPKTVATLLDRSDVAQMRYEQMAANAQTKAESAAARTEMMSTVAQIRADAMVSAAQLRVDAANQRAANGKIDTATGRMLITSEDANIKAASTQIQLLTRQLGDISPSKKAEREATQQQINEANDDIKTSKATKNLYMKQLGYPTADDVKAKTAPTPAASAATGKRADPLGLFK